MAIGLVQAAVNLGGAALSADRRSDGVLEQVLGRLSLEPSVTAARWRIEALTE